MSLEIIAEIHPQHGGTPAAILDLIREAKLNGADAAKVQLYDAEALLGPQWKYLELSWEQTVEVKRWCDEWGLEFMASVFDQKRLEWCERLGTRRYKIASPTVQDEALCESILALGKETIVSLGKWQGGRKPFGEDERIRYLYCKSEYPAMWSDLTDFPDDFPASGLDGLSDHTLGIEACLLAIARGARIIEKHMTLDKTQTKPTEKAHVCSMTPGELALLRRVGEGLNRVAEIVRGFDGSIARRTE